MYAIVVIRRSNEELYSIERVEGKKVEIMCHIDVVKRRQGQGQDISCPYGEGSI